LHNGNPYIREILKATREHLVLPKHVSVPQPTQYEHATAILTGQEPRKAPEASEQNIRAPSTSARIAIKAKTKILFIDAADLIAVEAKGNHVLLLHTSSSHILRGAISNIAEKLNLHGFVRIHRSVLVNAALVEEIHARPSGEYVLRVRGGREFIVTRTYKKNLRLLAQLWIGMEGF
jgi:two-component system LytT family response regulator